MDCPECGKPLFLMRHVLTIHPIKDNPDPDEFRVGVEVDSWDSETEGPDLFCRECGHKEPCPSALYDIV